MWSQSQQSHIAISRPTFLFSSWLTALSVVVLASVLGGIAFALASPLAKTRHQSCRYLGVVVRCVVDGKHSRLSLFSSVSAQILIAFLSIQLLALFSHAVVVENRHDLLLLSTFCHVLAPSCCPVRFLVLVPGYTGRRHGRFIRRLRAIWSSSMSRLATIEAFPPELSLMGLSALPWLSSVKDLSGETSST
jgi:hypothetical protein